MISTAEPALGSLMESKLHPPWVRPGIVRRASLLRTVRYAPAPIVTVTAPAGYGKTTFLAQWAEANQLPSAWLSLDDHDNDPSMLLAYLVQALDRAGVVDAAVLPAMLSPTTVETGAVFHELIALMAAAPAPFALILDNLEALHDQRCHDAVAELAWNLPHGSRLALRPSRPEAERAVAQTEGWPVGLYLVALAAVAAGSPGAALPAFRGDDRIVADYVRSELLSQLSPEMLAFQCRDIFRARPDLGVLPGRVDAVEASISPTRGAAAGASSLTAAELRVLPLLATHLSFPEIAERSYVSRHTVKSQAMSIYRKLGVTSRSGAVERATQVGLLGL